MIMQCTLTALLIIIGTAVINGESIGYGSREESSEDLIAILERDAIASLQLAIVGGDSQRLLVTTECVEAIHTLTRLRCPGAIEMLLPYVGSPVTEVDVNPVRTTNHGLLIDNAFRSIGIPAVDNALMVLQTEELPNRAAIRDICIAMLGEDGVRFRAQVIGADPARLLSAENDTP